MNKADKAVTKAEKVQNDANVKTAVKNNKERAKAKAAEEANAEQQKVHTPSASGGAVDYGQYAQAPAHNGGVVNGGW